MRIVIVAVSFLLLSSIIASATMLCIQRGR